MTTYFFMISTDPNVDPRRCAVGLMCAAEALTSGHEVEVFFASHAVQLLQGQFIDGLDSRVGTPSGTCRTMMESLIAGAKIACSTGSQALVGVTPENADEVLMVTDGLVWSGPPGVVAMSAAADVVLSF
ncbi:MAG: hypothetical protein O3B40_06840 [Actinobacteria bacterium]|nr:hypothetical protein [Actinomycetota bacterium]MDA2995542.1 hypothetical protein [Actinomycetota bacterium]